MHHRLGSHHPRQKRNEKAATTWRSGNWSRNCQSYCGPIDYYMRGSSLRRPLCGLLLVPCISGH